jgi:hypothetical protein
MIKSISTRDETESDVCQECGSVGKYSRQVGAAMVAYTVTVNGSGKPPSGFREVLKNIQKRSPGANPNMSSHI